MDESVVYLESDPFESSRSERGVEALRYKAITGPISPAIIRTMISGSLPPMTVGDSIDELCAALASAAKCFVVDIVSTARAIQIDRSQSTEGTHNEPIQAAHLLEAYRSMQLRGNILGLRHSVTDTSHTEPMVEEAASSAQAAAAQGDTQGQAAEDSLLVEPPAEEAPAAAPSAVEKEGDEAEAVEG